MTEFSHFLGSLEPWIHEFGSVAIFIILMLESFGLPLPGESLLIMAAILAGRGEISFSALLLSAWGGAVAGDNIGYLIGRILGHKLLQRYGRKMGLKPDRLRQAEAIFARYGPIAVGFARFFNILRQLNGVVAGALEMHWLRFLVFNALGGALWVMVWAATGFYFGRHSREMVVYVHRLGLIGAIMVLIVVIAILIWVLVFRVRRQRT
jgi:membrane protein DedA with SNARE-associated domain